MTVEELIKELEKYPSDMVVYTNRPDYFESRVFDDFNEVLEVYAHSIWNTKGLLIT